MTIGTIFSLKIRSKFCISVNSFFYYGFFLLRAHFTLIGSISWKAHQLSFKTSPNSRRNVSTVGVIEFQCHCFDFFFFFGMFVRKLEMWIESSVDADSDLCFLKEWSLEKGHLEVLAWKGFLNNDKITQKEGSHKAEVQ